MKLPGSTEELKRNVLNKGNTKQTPGSTEELKKHLYLPSKL